MVDDGSWLTITDAARMLGVSHQAIRKRVAKGTIQYRRNNQNQVVVLVARSAPPVDSRLHVQPQPNPVEGVDSVPMVPLSAMMDAIAQERAQMARLLAERDALHMGHFERLRAQAAIERGLLLERIDRAEVAAEQANEMLYELVGKIMSMPVPAPTESIVSMQSPRWWQRLFGKSRKETLGRGDGGC